MFLTQQGDPRSEIGTDLRDVPAYSYVEAGKVLRIPHTTVRAWCKGQWYESGGERRRFKRVIQLPTGHGTGLSYYNLIEAWVLRAMRTREGISLRAVREALDNAEESYDIDRLLIHRDLRFGAGELFLKQYSDLVSLKDSYQYNMFDTLKMYLHRVEYDEHGLAVQLFPLTRGDESPTIIEVNPFISFGRAIVARRGISTRAIVGRIDAGETPEHVAEDYGLRIEEVAEAIQYEVAA